METKQEPTYIELVWDGKIGKYRQVILNKTLQQNKEGVVFLSRGMALQKTYEEDN